MGHSLWHEARFWSWPGAPPIEARPIPSETDARFRGLVEMYRRAKNESLTVSEIRDAMTAILEQSSPQARARRLFHQMMAEQAAITGHRDGVIDFIESAVTDGLLDLGWMSRLRLFDPIRGDARFLALRQRVRAERVAVAWRGPAESLDEALSTIR
jgi:aminoglycoside phosphotransferase (APT) family kinase protein